METIAARLLIVARCVAIGPANDNVVRVCHILLPALTRLTSVAQIFRETCS